MISIKESIIINAKTKQIFDFIANYSNDLKWRTGVISMDYLLKREGVIGTEVYEIFRYFILTYHTVSKVSSFDSFNHSICFKSIKYKHYIEGQRKVSIFDDNSSLFTFEIEAKLTGILTKFEPIVGYLMKRRIKNDLIRLKKLLENY